VLGTTKGVNVISPTWFYLDDNEGGIASLASLDYVTYCHQQGVEVWGLVSNLENAEVSTNSVLSVTSSRDNLVNNLISEAIRYDLDGINVDFESLSAETGDGFLQFIRELSLKCENNGIVLSVDNYVPAAYNTFYDRAEQAVFADYIILMAYDEHYKGSDEGSVASLSFVTKGVEDTLLEVPAEQLVLGIPFYTRVWQITPDETEESGYRVDSEAVGMSEVESRVAANNVTLEWLDDCGQYYAEYEKDGSTYKIWEEDQNSIEKKLEVMTSNNLAGASFWKLGYEKNTVWDTIVKFM
jgi:spore germination protein YaaH